MAVKLNPATGKYYASFYYTDYQGKRHRKKKEGFVLARDAKAWEREFLEKQAGGITIAFKLLVEEYLKDCKARLKPTTLKQKELLLANNIIPFFGRLPIGNITPSMVRQFQNGIIKQYPNQRTQKGINTQLSAVLNYAVRFYGLPFNPCAKAGGIGNMKKDIIRYWTLEEFNQFLQAMQNPKYKTRNLKLYYTAFNVLFYTGVRIGELLGLSVGDYDKQAQTLSINKNLVKVGGVEYLQTPKTKKSKRIITLPPFLCSLLDNYIKMLYRPEASEKLFLTNQDTMLKNIKRFAKLAGVQEITLHDLRHSHASMLVNMDVNPLAISERLGHESVQTTLNTYSHLYQSKAREVAARIEIYKNGTVLGTVLADDKPKEPL